MSKERTHRDVRTLEPLVALAPDLTATALEDLGPFPDTWFRTGHWGSAVVRTLSLEYLAGISKTTSLPFAFNPFKINSAAGPLAFLKSKACFEYINPRGLFWVFP